MPGESKISSVVTRLVEYDIYLQFFQNPQSFSFFSDEDKNSYLYLLLSLKAFLANNEKIVFPIELIQTLLGFVFYDQMLAINNVDIKKINAFAEQLASMHRPLSLPMLCNFVERELFFDNKEHVRFFIKKLTSVNANGKRLLEELCAASNTEPGLALDQPAHAPRESTLSADERFYRKLYLKCAYYFMVNEVNLDRFSLNEYMRLFHRLYTGGYDFLLRTRPDVMKNLINSLYMTPSFRNDYGEEIGYKPPPCWKWLVTNIYHHENDKIRMLLELEPNLARILYYDTSLAHFAAAFGNAEVLELLHNTGLVNYHYSAGGSVQSSANGKFHHDGDYWERDDVRCRLADKTCGKKSTLFQGTVLEVARKNNHLQVVTQIERYMSSSTSSLSNTPPSSSTAVSTVVATATPINTLSATTTPVSARFSKLCSSPKIEIKQVSEILLEAFLAFLSVAGTPLAGIVIVGGFGGIAGGPIGFLIGALIGAIAGMICGTYLLNKMGIFASDYRSIETLPRVTEEHRGDLLPLPEM